jgi:hypothetical protein
MWHVTMHDSQVLLWIHLFWYKPLILVSVLVHTLCNNLRDLLRILRVFYYG